LTSTCTVVHPQLLNPCLSVSLFIYPKLFLFIYCSKATFNRAMGFSYLNAFTIAWGSDKFLRISPIYLSCTYTYMYHTCMSVCTYYSVVNAACTWWTHTKTIVSLFVQEKQYEDAYTRFSNALQVTGFRAGTYKCMYIYHTYYDCSIANRLVLQLCPLLLHVETVCSFTETYCWDHWERNKGTPRCVIQCDYGDFRNCICSYLVISLF